MSPDDSPRIRVLLVVEDDLDMQLLITLMLSADPRMEICGEPASNAADAIALARETGPGIVVLDHFIEGDIMGLQAAPMIKTVAPAARILLFTSHNLAAEVSREPAIDAFLSKNNVVQLLPTVQRLAGLEPMPKKPRPSAGSERDNPLRA